MYGTRSKTPRNKKLWLLCLGVGLLLLCPLLYVLTASYLSNEEIVPYILADNNLPRPPPFSSIIENSMLKGDKFTSAFESFCESRDESFSWYRFFQAASYNVHVSASMQDDSFPYPIAPNGANQHDRECSTFKVHFVLLLKGDRICEPLASVFSQQKIVYESITILVDDETGERALFSLVAFLEQFSGVFQERRIRVQVKAQGRVDMYSILGEIQSQVEDKEDTYIVHMESRIAPSISLLHSTIFVLRTFADEVVIGGKGLKLERGEGRYEYRNVPSHRYSPDYEQVDRLLGYYALRASTSLYSGKVCMKSLLLYIANSGRIHEELLRDPPLAVLAESPRLPFDAFQFRPLCASQAVLFYISDHHDYTLIAPLISRFLARSYGVVLLSSSSLPPLPPSACIAALSTAHLPSPALQLRNLLARVKFDALFATERAHPLPSPYQPIILEGRGLQAGAYHWLVSLSPRDIATYFGRPRWIINIITYNRIRALSRLLTSLENAHFLGDKHITLQFSIDAAAPNALLQVVRNFRWRYGVKRIYFRHWKGGLMAANSESWYPSSYHTYGILLEDDIEVSPYFYSWLKYQLLSLNYLSAHTSHTSISSISLYTPRLIELMRPRKAIHPYELYGPEPIYEQPLPCSWGAMFYPKHWMVFRHWLESLDGINARKEKPIKGYQVPYSPTNGWTGSWKRHMLEMMQYLMYTTVYPNHIHEYSYSTNHIEVGEHITSKDITYTKIQHYTVPLVEREVWQTMIIDQLTPVTHIPLLDSFHNMIDRAELYQRKHAFEKVNTPYLHIFELVKQFEEKLGMATKFR